MKSYLSLIPISARVRRRQNRLTILCIVTAVFLVTAIFSVADMMLRTQTGRAAGKSGRWHLEVIGITPEQAAQLVGQPDVVRVGAGAVFNENGESAYRLNGKRVVLYGADADYVSLNRAAAFAGTYPQAENEVLLGKTAARVLHVGSGDTVTLTLPDGTEKPLTVTGVGGIDEDFYGEQYSIVDAYLPQEAFAALLTVNSEALPQTHYELEYTSAARAAKALPKLRSRYGETAVQENLQVMGSAGQSSSTAFQTVYGMAAVLFVLVLLAGVLMISGSMNSNLAQRIQFFGMMRCIGMSKSQIIRFVRLEALNWCKTAVPVGVLLGTLASWSICAALHYGIGGEFSTTPVFQISPVGLVSGIVVGIVTVLLAAESPARRAARVSPVAAVSGTGENLSASRHASNYSFGKIELSLGAHHAIAGKKNLFLMTSSFALSIVLVLCSSVLLKFAGLLLPGQAPWQPDILLNGYGNEQVLSRSMAEQLRAIPGVGYVWGATGLTNTPASSPQKDVEHVVLGSYDDFMMEKSRDLVVAGRMADQAASSNEVMTIYNKNNPLKVGDTVYISGRDLTIVGAFSEGMFPDDVTVICPQALFDRLVGAQNYNMIGVLLNDSATEQTVMQIAHLATDEIIVSDVRERNSQEAATYLASRIVVYGFLAIIGLISLFNIVNSISMSVSARTKQYGVMRAIGMDGSQLTRMVAAEAFTYAVSGLIVGCIAGLLLSRMLYARLITRYFGMTWHLPGMTLCLIILFVFAAAALAVHAPAKRIRNMAITETINEL